MASRIHRGCVGAWGSTAQLERHGHTAAAEGVPRPAPDQGMTAAPQWDGTAGLANGMGTHVAAKHQGTGEPLTARKGDHLMWRDKVAAATCLSTQRRLLGGCRVLPLRRRAIVRLGRAAASCPASDSHRTARLAARLRAGTDRTRAMCASVQLIEQQSCFT